MADCLRRAHCWSPTTSPDGPRDLSRQRHRVPFDVARDGARQRDWHAQHRHLRHERPTDLYAPVGGWGHPGRCQNHRAGRGALRAPRYDPAWYGQGQSLPAIFFGSANDTGSNAYDPVGNVSQGSLNSILAALATTVGASSTVATQSVTLTARQSDLGVGRRAVDPLWHHRGWRQLD